MKNLIKESNRIKYEACENYKKQLKGILSYDEMKLFEDSFYKETKGYIFKRKGEN